MRPVDEPGAPDLEFLSLYEFLRYWRVELAAFPRSEAEMSAGVSNEYQAMLTPSGVDKVREAGREKVEAGEDGVQMVAQLKAGVDYVVKEGGSYSWVPFPDVPEMETLRHTWVLVRNERPKNPSFHGAPQPKHGAGEEDRNGLLLMVYFRAFTLRDDVVCGVPHLRDFRGTHASFTEASLEWLKKGMPCEETKRYVQNYMGVVDLRPVTDEDLVKHEDELYSDEELDPRIVDAATRRKTHVGGTAMEKEDRRLNALVEGDKEKSREAMARGDAVWGEDMSRKSGKRKKRGGGGALTWDDAAVQRAQAAASASRSQEGTGAGAAESAPEIVAGKKATASSVRRWRNRLEDDGLNAGQRSVVEKVVDRVLTQEFEIPARKKKEGERRSDMQPLLWVLHGGPGTGGSFVIDKIRKYLFEKEMGWTHGIDFQVAALQATNASALDGNTIHSAFGVGVNKPKEASAGGDGGAESKKKTKKELAAQRMSKWKWLIIDEVSMVSANFLA